MVTYPHSTLVSSSGIVIVRKQQQQRGVVVIITSHCCSSTHVYSVIHVPAVFTMTTLRLSSSSSPTTAEQYVEQIVQETCMSLPQKTGCVSRMKR
jgi:hypothetical protein